jgi:hypothetical protein
VRSLIPEQESQFRWPKLKQRMRMVFCPRMPCPEQFIEIGNLPATGCYLPWGDSGTVQLQVSVDTKGAAGGYFRTPFSGGPFLQKTAATFGA